MDVFAPDGDLHWQTTLLQSKTRNGGKMKRLITLFSSSMLMIAVANVYGQASSSKDSTQSQKDESSIIILEPSGAEPTPGSPTTGPEYQPVPTTSSDTGTALQTNTTITISQTFTNDPNAITIIGTVGSETEKQTVETKLQEALPGKTIKNYLNVSSKNVFEPSGAESPKDKNDKEKDNEQEDDQSDSQLDVGGK